MRQIDNMSSADIDTLRLKGMLPERTIPAEKPTAIKTSQVLPAITKAIMREDNLIARCNELVTHRNRAQAHADKLAEALREIAPKDGHLPPPAMVRIIAAQALAAYEAAQ